nr:sigma factor [Hymenobacter siberiensis]
MSRYGNEMFRFARHRVATVAAAEELVQETIVSTLGTLASFRQESSECTWLFVILRRKLIDYYRQQARSPLVPLLGAADEAGNGTYFETGARTQWRKAPGMGCRRHPARTARAGRAAARLPGPAARPAPGRVQPALRGRNVGRGNLSAAGHLAGQLLGIIHRAKLQLRKCLEKHWFSGS